MIAPAALLDALKANDVRFVTGVPDSLLKEACAAITARLPKDAHVIAANEGAAVALAIGHYLASGRPALVYMQNSGLGNTLNPLASLADPAIYGAPMVLMIGWRGEILPDGRQLKDEPQHVVQGQVTVGQLELLGIPTQLLDADSDIEAALARSVAQTLQTCRPAALLVRKNAFAPWTETADAVPEDAALTREAAIAAVAAAAPEGACLVSTTGMGSRELFELRKATDAAHDRDFLTVGGMGHAISIATGIALAQPERTVLCLDGDGAMLMHLGAATESARRRNLLHIALNNGAHDSVGGQPTAAPRLDLCALAKACGYPQVRRALDAQAVQDAIEKLLASGEPAFLEILCRKGARANLGRPDRSPAENKADFMRFLSGRAR